MAPQSHPVLRSDMHSTETRIELTTKNNATLRKTGPSFGMSVEGDVRFPAPRTLGIGWEITLRNGEIFTRKCSHLKGARETTSFSSPFLSNEKGKRINIELSE